MYRKAVQIINTYAYIYIYIYIYIHTHTHTYIYIYIYIFFFSHLQAVESVKDARRAFEFW